MTPFVGEIVLADFVQVSSLPVKLRPAVVLARVPVPYQRWLLAGITTRMQDMQVGWDEPLLGSDAAFAATGLKRDSAVRLSFLFAVTERSIVGRTGTLERELVSRLRARLSAHLQADF